MPILTARLGELLIIADQNASTLRSDRLRHYAVAAFGAEHPVLEERCLLLDGVAMLVRDELARKGMARLGAATVTRAYWPEWTEALAWVEHKRAPIVFAVAELRGGGWWCAHGRADKLSDFVTNQPLERLLCVNLAQIKIDMDTRAAKAGFDLSDGTYCLPPDHPVLVEWLKEYRDRRAALQRKFDPMRGKAPSPPSVAQRRVLQELTCSIH